MGLKDQAKDLAESRGMKAGGVEFRRLNTKCQCQVPGCDRKRSGWSYFCISHLRKKAAYGDPRAGRIPLSILRPYIEQVMPVLEANDGSHAGIALVKKFLRDHTKLAQEGQRFPIWQALIQLEDSRPILETIARIAAVYLFQETSHLEERYLRGSDKALYANVALIITKGMQFQPNGLPRINIKEAWVFGEKLCKNIGAFFLKLCRSLDKAEVDRQSKLEALCAEWDTDRILCPCCSWNVSKPCPPEQQLKPKKKRKQPNNPGSRGKIRYYGEYTDLRTGEKNLTLAELARRYNMSYQVLFNRVRKYGWSLREALETPVGRPGGKRKYGRQSKEGQPSVSVDLRRNKN